jgi:hypothetical protein
MLVISLHRVSGYADEYNIVSFLFYLILYLITNALGNDSSREQTISGGNQQNKPIMCSAVKWMSRHKGIRLLHYAEPQLKVV